MNQKQREALRKLSERYGVEFQEDSYFEGFDLPKGWVQGWIEEPHKLEGGGWAGGKLYVGCDPEGIIIMMLY